MSYTAEHLAALKEAAASGVKSVTYEGRTVTYHSLMELRSLIATIEAQLAAPLANATGTSGYNPVYCKGI